MVNKKRGKKVIVGMSGGVDSAVAAALLKKQGYDVIGVFMLFWFDESGPSYIESLDSFTNRCCSREAQERARLTAEQIGIPFYTVNVRDEFKKAVVDHFLLEHKLGHTPNPCIVCNKEIKFRVLIKKALEMGSDFIATGHYARLRKGKSRKAGIKLLKADDRAKDQTYFLYNLTQAQLVKIIFPIGGWRKAEVRRLAKKFHLAVYNRPESQDICFIDDADMRGFLKRNLPLKAGDIVNTRGEKIGTHEGLPLYTIGQRKGIGLGGGRPYYVVASDIKSNKLTISEDPRDPLLWKETLAAYDVNWVSGRQPALPMKVQASVRYRHKSSAAVIKSAGKGNYEVGFQKAERAITPGQSVVFYKGNELLGGGIIR